MLTKYRILASLHNAEPLCGLWPHYKLMGRVAAHFRYLVSIRYLVNLPYIDADNWGLKVHNNVRNISKNILLRKLF